MHVSDCCSPITALSVLLQRFRDGKALKHAATVNKNAHDRKEGKRNHSFPTRAQECVLPFSMSGEVVATGESEHVVRGLIGQVTLAKGVHAAQTAQATLEALWSSCPWACQTRSPWRCHQRPSFRRCTTLQLCGTH